MPKLKEHQTKVELILLIVLVLYLQPLKVPLAQTNPEIAPAECSGCQCC